MSIQDNAKRLSHSSLLILRQHKKMLILSIANLIFNLPVFMIILAALFRIEATATATGHTTVQQYLLFFGLLLILFLVMNFVNLFFLTALTDCALRILQNQAEDFKNAFKTALRLSGKIFCWQIFMTTAGVVVRFAEYWIDAWETHSIKQTYLHNMKWVIATTFIIPTMINERCGIIDAVKKSAALIHDNWGSAEILRIQPTAILFVFRLISFLPLIIALIIGKKTIVYIGSTITGILFFSISAINTALIFILIAALYLHAKKIVLTPYFEDTALQNAFQSEKKQ